MDLDLKLDEFPEYGQPPVTETVVGIEFAALPIGFMGLASLHDLWKVDFPTPIEQEALPPTRPVQQGAPGFPFRIGMGPPPARLWMLSEDQHFLVQVQSDRLTLNWRRLGAEASSYPGFEVLRARFELLFAEFQSHISKSLAIAVEPMVVEWTYVNEIDGADRMLSIWSESDLPLPGSLLLTRFQNVRALDIGGISAQLTIGAEPISLGLNHSTSLTVSTQIFLTPGHATDATALIADAHYTSRQAFEAITSEQAKSDWGSV